MNEIKWKINTESFSLERPVKIDILSYKSWNENDVVLF